MSTFPIPDKLAGAYKGAGHALAAVKDGRIVDLLYLRDLLPGFSDVDEDGNGIDAADVPIKDARLAPTIAHLSRLGAVSVGLCSSWEFNEL